VVFLAVYIREAHARDEWPLGPTLSCVDQPKEIAQRAANARSYCTKFSFDNIPMLVDSLSDSFEKQFAAWPFRFYAITMDAQGQMRLGFKAQPKLEPEFCYDVTCLGDWLARK